jgi:hypothetical protein
MSDDDDALSWDAAAFHNRTHDFVRLPINKHEEYAVQLHQQQFETDDMPHKDRICYW